MAWKVKITRVKPYKAMVTAYEVDYAGVATGRDTAPEPFELYMKNYDEVVGRIMKQIDAVMPEEPDPDASEIESRLNSAIRTGN